METTVRADRVGEPLLFNERAMTVQEVAREMDPAYATAADRAALPRKEAPRPDSPSRTTCSEPPIVFLHLMAERPK
jgi:hypothetical protein